MSDLVLELKSVKKHFRVANGSVLRRKVGWVKAVDGIDLAVRQKEIVSLVGESGCGKTTTSKMLLMLERPTAGQVLFKGKDIFALRGEELKEYRRSVQAVFQDPFSSLSPRMRVGEIVAEPLMASGLWNRRSARQRTREVLTQVGLNERSADLFPHEFSGGQRQRIAVARALTLQPACIVLDEPVSALDVSIRAQILNLLLDLHQEFGLSYVIIAHDLAVVRYISHWVGVMYLGRIVELAPTNQLYTNPLHPYTQALLSAVLPSHPRSGGSRVKLPGEVPSPLNPPAGCTFHTRCPAALDECAILTPPLQSIYEKHLVACHRRSAKEEGGRAEGAGGEVRTPSPSHPARPHPSLNKS